MCRHVHVTLSANDRKQVKALAGIMLPVYASVLLAVIAIVAVTSAPRPGELIAASSAASATR